MELENEDSLEEHEDRTDTYDECDYYAPDNGKRVAVNEKKNFERNYFKDDSRSDGLNYKGGEEFSGMRIVGKKKILS